MKKLLKKVWNFVKRLWESLDNTVDEYVDVAIKITEAIKKVVDSPVDDIIFTLLKNTGVNGALLDKVQSTIEKKLPKILEKLLIIQDIAEIDNPNEQLKAILASINFKDDQSKAAFYHSLASMLIEDLSDGELSWSEAVVLAEFIYNKKYKEK